jgi:hypothetical protein
MSKRLIWKDSLYYFIDIIVDQRYILIREIEREYGTGILLPGFTSCSHNRLETRAWERAEIGRGGRVKLHEERSNKG